MNVVEERGVFAPRTFVLALACVPECAELDACQPRAKTTEVIGVGMGEHGSRDRSPSSRAQHGCEYAFASVDWAANESATVDDHCAPVRKIDDCGVALADVEKGDAQRSRG